MIDTSSTDLKPSNNLPHKGSYPNYVGQIFLALHISHRCTEVDMKHVSIGRY